MAGAPVQRKMAKDIEVAGGYDVAILERIRNGETLAAIARTFGVGRSMLHRYFKKTPERSEAFAQAKLQGAASSVEQAQANLSDAVEHSREHANSAYVQATRNDADFRKWVAGMTDRRAFGATDAASVTVNIQELHLAALQAQGGPEAQLRKEIAPPRPPPVVEEITDEEVEVTDE